MLYYNRNFTDFFYIHRKFLTNLSYFPLIHLKLKYTDLKHIRCVSKQNVASATFSRKRENLFYENYRLINCTKNYSNN